MNCMNYIKLGILTNIQKLDILQHRISGRPKVLLSLTRNAYTLVTSFAALDIAMGITLGCTIYRPVPEKKPVARPRPIAITGAYMINHPYRVSSVPEIRY